MVDEATAMKESRIAMEVLYPSWSYLHMWLTWGWRLNEDRKRGFYFNDNHIIPLWILVERKQNKEQLRRLPCDSNIDELGNK